MQPIKDFMNRIFPGFYWAGDTAFFDTRKIDLEALANGNYKFSLFADGAGRFHPMTTIEVDPGRRFWVRVVEVVRVFTGATFAIPDELVAWNYLCLPGADLLTQEVVKEERRLPEMPDYKAPVTSKSTKTRRELYDENERDFLDESGSGTG